MENIEKLEIPANFTDSEISKKQKKAENLKKARESKKAGESTTDKLSKVNRVLPCIFCETERILNPTQYQAYFDYWGDEDKIKRNFICQPCDTQQKENPFSFWLINHDNIRKLSRGLKAIFEVYKSSPKSYEDGLSLQSMTNHLVSENKINVENIEFILQNKLPTGLKIKNMPFVGAFEILPYNETKINILT